MAAKLLNTQIGRFIDELQNLLALIAVDHLNLMLEKITQFSVKSG